MLPSCFVTGDKFAASIKLVPRSRQHVIKFVPGLQKHVPYPPCTGINLCLKYLDTARMLRRVTQPPHIAGPLAARQICTEHAVYQDFANAQARVLQPIPATVPSLQNTCFFANPDSATLTISSYHKKSYLFTWTLPSGQLNQTVTDPARLPGLCHLDNIIIPGKPYPFFRALPAELI